jgi:hypothetical protein
MKIVIVRLNLDRYDLQMIERLVVDGVITLTEARESNAVKDLGEWQEVLWVRKMQPMIHRYESVI